MTFPNTYKSIKKLIAAEVLTLLSDIMTIVLSILSILIVKNNIPLDDISSMLVIALYSATLLFLAARLCCSIVYVVALRRAGKDDANFKIAFYSIIITLVLSAGGFVLAFNKEAENIAELLIILTSMLAKIYIIEGIRSLSKKLGHLEMDKTGAVIYAIIFTVFIIRTCVIILILIVGSDYGSTQSALLGITDSIISMFESTLILFYFIKALKIFSKE